MHRSPVRWSNRDTLLEAVRRHGFALQLATAELQGDRDVVLEAVRRQGTSLKFAAAELQGDRDVVLEAVRQDGRALLFASAELQGDRDVVLEAVRRHWSALQFATVKLRRDLNVVLEAVRKEGCAVIHAATELRGDPVLQPACVACNRIAGSGARAPAFMVSSVAWALDDGKSAIKVVSCSLGGDENSYLLGSEATIGDLATLLVRRCGAETNFVFLHMPRGGVIQPSEVLTPLSAFVS